MEIFDNIGPDELEAGDQWKQVMIQQFPPAEDWENCNDSPSISMLCRKLTSLTGEPVSRYKLLQYLESKEYVKERVGDDLVVLIASVG